MGMKSVLQQFKQAAVNPPKLFEQLSDGHQGNISVFTSPLKSF